MSYYLFFLLCLHFRAHSGALAVLLVLLGCSWHPTSVRAACRREIDECFYDDICGSLTNCWSYPITDDGCDPRDGSIWSVRKDRFRQCLSYGCREEDNAELQSVVSSCPDSRVICRNKVDTWIMGESNPDIEVAYSCQEPDCSNPGEIWYDTKANLHKCSEEGSGGSSASSGGIPTTFGSTSPVPGLSTSASQAVAATDSGAAVFAAFCAIAAGVVWIG